MCIHKKGRLKFAQEGLFKTFLTFKAPHFPITVLVWFVPVGKFILITGKDNCINWFKRLKVLVLTLCQ